MSEKELLENLMQIDNVLARCVNPALNRADHDGIRQIMSVIVQRIKLSYKLEDEKKTVEATEQKQNMAEAV